jgi:hypothetical protein
MMQLLKIALLLGGILLLAVGGEGIFHAARSRQLMALTCEQFVEQPPQTLWVRISGCDIDYLGAGYHESKGRITELFFPMRPAGRARTTPASVLMATRDPEVLAIAQHTIGEGRQPDQEAFLVMMLRIVTMLKVSRQVEGYARSGVIGLLRTRRTLAGLSAPLAPDVVVIDLRGRPGFVRHGIEAAVGLLLVMLPLGLARRPSPAPADPPALDVPERSAPPPDPIPRRLPGLMLLNIDPAAGAGAVEHAPPIGTRSEVAQRLGSVFPGVRVDGDGRGTVRGEDWSLTLHLGDEDTVWTVTVEACGDGSVDAIRTLAAATRWRIFVPKRGGFVDAGGLGLMDRTGRELTGGTGGGGDAKKRFLR